VEMENNFNVFTFGLLSSFPFGWEILREKYEWKWNIISHFILEQEKCRRRYEKRDKKSDIK
jgi:hypothetical protein